MSSNDKAFGVNDLKPNTSHLIPGKTSDGSMVDPLQTAKHSRDEVDELIALGKEARGETIIKTSKVVQNWAISPEELVSTPVVNDDFIAKLIRDEDFAGRLMDLEKEFDAFKDRVTKKFKEAGFVL